MLSLMVELLGSAMQIFHSRAGTVFNASPRSIGVTFNKQISLETELF